MDESQNAHELEDPASEMSATDYLMQSPGTQERLLPALKRTKLSNAPVDPVNATQIPVELRPASGGRAWLLPESLWTKLQEIVDIVSAEVG